MRTACKQRVRTRTQQATLIWKLKVRTTSANSVRTTREQRTNNARTAREQRMNNARTACANSHEQRANYEREQRRTHPRTARRARLARGSPRLSMPHSYSIFLVNNKIKVQMGVSSALFLFLCVNWFTACVGGRRLLLLLLLLRMAGRPWCRLLPHCTAQTITRIVLGSSRENRRFCG